MENSRMRHWAYMKRRIVGIVSIFAALSGCATDQSALSRVELAPNQSVAPEIYRAPIENDYRIAVGDKLTIRSYDDSKLHQEVVVRPDGRISVLFLGDVKVVEMKPDELDALLTESYSKYLRSPEITVVVDKPAALAIYVGGEVSKPSVIPLSGNLTILQSIIAAGDFLPTGDRKQVLLFRRFSSDMVEVSKVDLASVILSGAPDLYVRQHDIIYVPKTGIANIGDFVDAYINRIIPNAVRLQYNWTDIR